MTKHRLIGALVTGKIVVRFYTTHLLTAVVISAFAFALVRHPESLWAIIVPLIGGVFVVLPVLGTVEILTGRDPYKEQLGWSAICLICFIGTIGAILAVIVLSGLLNVVL